jgi:hypothetical protein
MITLAAVTTPDAIRTSMSRRPRLAALVEPKIPGIRTRK